MKNPLLRIELWIVRLLIVYIGSILVQAQTPITNQELFFGGTNTSDGNPSKNYAYITWVKEKSSFYDHAAFIPQSSTSSVWDRNNNNKKNDKMNGVAIHWRIVDDKRIHLAVAARANGWVGFGLAEAGGMKGADIVYYVASTNQLVDAHVLDDIENGPRADDCQNWELQNAQSSGGFLIFEAIRDLDTGDTHDRAIINDADPGSVPAHRIIAAWGDSDQISYHSPDNQVRSSIRFHGGPGELALFYETMQAQAEGSFVVSTGNYTIKPIDTEYKYFCFSREDLVALIGAPADKPIHGIGWETLLDPNAAPFVHHINVYGSKEQGNSFPLSKTICGFGFTDQLAYVWTPGMAPLVLPEDVGALYMDVDGFNSLVLEIHYNNPNRLADIVDNSGVRFFFTTKLRSNNLFFYLYGDSTILLRGRPVGDPAASSSVVTATDSKTRFFSHSFNCPSRCSSLDLSQPVTVVREYLHMHKTGRRIQSLHIRNGTVVRTGYIDFWDFPQQGHHMVMQHPFQVLSGDTFEVRCFYEPLDTTIFGFGTQEEMCVAYLLFYRPRKHGINERGSCVDAASGLLCQENHIKQALTSTSLMHRVFGVPSQTCSKRNSSTTTISEKIPVLIDANGEKKRITGASTGMVRLFSKMVQTAALIGAALVLMCNVSMLRSCGGR